MSLPTPDRAPARLTIGVVTRNRPASLRECLGSLAVVGDALADVIDDSERPEALAQRGRADRKSTRLNSSHLVISYAVFCLKKKKFHLMHSLWEDKQGSVYGSDRENRRIQVFTAEGRFIVQ